MRVYRLERQNGWGEYRGVFCTSGTLNYPEDSHYANFGCGVEKAHWNDDYRFACESIESLILYFGSDFAVQLNEGAIIVEYTIDKRHILFDKRQVEIAFLSTKVKQRIVILEGEEQCTKQLKTSQSTGRTGRVNKISVTESLQDGLVLSSNWQLTQTQAEDWSKNLKRMEFYNELFTQEYPRRLSRSLSIWSDVDS